MVKELCSIHHPPFSPLQHVYLGTRCEVDRVSVPSSIAIDKLMVRIGEGQSSRVSAFSVKLEPSEIILFTLKRPSYVYIAVSSLQ